MRAAYDLRSTLAHGGEVSGAKVPRRPDGSEVTVVDFVATIQTYIRNALVKQLTSPTSQGRRTNLLIGMNWFSPVSKTKFLTRLVRSDCPECAI